MTVDVRVATGTDYIEASRYAKKEQYGAKGEPDHATLESINGGAAVTLYDPASGRIGCVVGLNLYWNGVGTFWSVTTEHLADHPIGYTRCLLDLLEQTVKRLGLHRVEMDVRADYLAGQRWAEALGFEKESLLKNYGSDKSDYYKYRRLF